MMRVPYDHRLEPIDERLVELIAQRMKISKGTNGYPTKDQFERWSEDYNLDKNVIASVFSSMNNPCRPARFPASPQNLTSIIPVMQKTTIDDVTYQVTRMEQFSDFSLVYIEIYTKEESETIELNVQLMLNIEGLENRNIQLHRSQGNTNQTSIVYMVSPTLPDDLKLFKFGLVPCALPHHPRPPERILDQVVDF